MSQLRFPVKGPGPRGRGSGLGPTKVGFYFLGLALLVGLAAVNTGNNGLFLVTSLMFASLVAAHFLGSTNLRGLELSASQHGEVFVGRPFHLGLHIHHRGRILPRLLLALRLNLPDLDGTRSRPRFPATFLPRLRPGEEQELRLEAVARRRGRHVLTEVQVSSLFPFGLFDKGRKYPVRLEWLVFPEIYPRGETRSATLSGHGSETVPRTGHGQELLGLRPYLAGDDPRTIHWKQSARQGQLISQQRHHEEVRRLLILLDNATGELDEAGQKRFESLVSEAATAALDFLDDGCEVALLTRDASLPFGDGVRQRLRLLEILALVAPLPRESGRLQSSEPTSRETRRLHLGMNPADEVAA